MNVTFIAGNRPDKEPSSSMGQHSAGVPPSAAVLRITLTGS